MEAITQRILELTTAEKRKLQHLILGYGNLEDAATKANVHRHTLRNVARLGYGKPETIEKIRSTLLAA